MKPLLLAILVVTCGSVFGEPVILRYQKLPRIIVGREDYQSGKAKVPAQHQVGGLKHFEFVFRPKKAGKLTIPPCKIELAGKTFFIPGAELLVFEEKPAKRTAVVAAWPHPNEPLHVVQWDFAGGDETDLPTFSPIESKLINVPKGFELTESGGLSRNGQFTQVFHAENSTGKPVTLTAANFKDCNLPPDFPKITIPSLSEEQVKLAPAPPSKNPVELKLVAPHQFHAQKNLPYDVRVKVPAKHRVAGIERFHFTFPPGAVGPVVSPKIRVSVGDQPFTIPATPFVVFDEPPKEATYHLAHAPHPKQPNLVVFRLYYRGRDHKARIAFSRTRFGPTPLDVESRWIALRRAGAGAYAMTFSVENLSNEPFTVSKLNFESLPKEFPAPHVTIPPVR